MRDLKFRIWDNDTGQFVSGEHPRFIGNVNGIYLFDKNYRILCGVDGQKPKDWTFQQFTGLLDKNSKEIYEGDIIRWEDQIVTKATVEFDTARFILNIFSHPEYSKTAGKYFTDFYRVPLSKLEVIGNIFENSELLNEI